jgi:hypothetical protein
MGKKRKKKRLWRIPPAPSQLDQTGRSEERWLSQLQSTDPSNPTAMPAAFTGMSPATDAIARWIVLNCKFASQ